MKILVFPKDNNPYQELLYSELRSKIEVKYLVNPIQSSTIGLFLLFFQIIYYRINGFTIFHLHWLYPFYPPKKNWVFNNIFSRAFLSFFFLLFIIFIKFLQYRLVWTVHNVLPLGKQFNDDILIVRILSKLTNSKIVHSKTTLNNMEKLGINTNDSYIIPIGNYSKLYPNNISKEYARKKLGINKDDFVFCFFGKIERYKGVMKLIEEFLVFKNKHLKLIIAGECQDSDLKKIILDNIGYDNILLHINFIPDDMIQVFLNAADIMVYPFQSITTSSSVILALSFGRPIICPRIGNLEDLPENVGFFYYAKDKQGLLNCLKKAVTNKEKLEEKERNGLKYTENLSWEKIANKTYKVYKNIL